MQRRPTFILGAETRVVYEELLELVAVRVEAWLPAQAGRAAEQQRTVSVQY